MAASERKSLQLRKRVIAPEGEQLLSGVAPLALSEFLEALRFGERLRPLQVAEHLLVLSVLVIVG